MIPFHTLNPREARRPDPFRRAILNEKSHNFKSVRKPRCGRGRAHLQSTVMRGLVIGLAGLSALVLTAAVAAMPPPPPSLAQPVGDPIPGAVVQRPAFRPEPHASCPSDAELLHPVSVGALSNAYARARVCFAQQVDRGKKWADVK